MINKIKDWLLELYSHIMFNYTGNADYIYACTGIIILRKIAFITDYGEVVIVNLVEGDVKGSIKYYLVEDCLDPTNAILMNWERYTNMITYKNLQLLGEL